MRYESERRLFDLPLVSIALGPDPDKNENRPDVRYLLRYLNITSPEEALTIVTRYFDEEQLPAKTRLVLEELLGG